MKMKRNNVGMKCQWRVAAPSSREYRHGGIESWRKRGVGVKWQRHRRGDGGEISMAAGRPNNHLAHRGSWRRNGEMKISVRNIEMALMKASKLSKWRRAGNENSGVNIIKSVKSDENNVLA
jgi:hypothetical protein